MLRVLGLFAVVGIAAALALTGGRIGPVDLTEVPVPLIAFVTVTALVVLGLRRI